MSRRESISRVAVATLFAFCAAANAVERLVVKDDGGERELSGKLIVEAEDGGVLLMTPDGELWPIEAESIVKRERDETPFAPLDREAMDAAVLADLPADFKLHHTAHYTIAYNTSPAYAKWVGGLYERLYAAFLNFWKQKGIKLQEPELPLVVLVFDGKASYGLHAERELGDLAKSIVGYYSLKTNRVTMHDLTGVEAATGGARVSTTERIQHILQQPAAERNVATIVHEATHQLAYNTGLHVRYSGLPFWVSEGLAVYFESPDLKNAKGWRSIGSINRYNLMQFQRRLVDRPADSLTRLICDDGPFRDAEKAPAAYAEAWALNYFLFKTRAAKYVEYIKAQGEWKPLVEFTPEQRLAEFRRCFGDDLTKLDGEFVKFMRKLE